MYSVYKNLTPSSCLCLSIMTVNTSDFFKEKLLLQLNILTLISHHPFSSMSYRWCEMSVFRFLNCVSGVPVFVASLLFHSDRCCYSLIFMIVAQRTFKMTLGALYKLLTISDSVYFSVNRKVLSSDFNGRGCSRLVGLCDSVLQ